jgi:DNA-binding NtrC family response regulator
MPSRQAPSTAPASSLCWSGRPPGDELARRLSAGKATLVKEARFDRLEVVASERADRAPAAPVHPWLWLAPGAPPLGAIRAAAAAGAVDVIDASLGSEAVATRLLARLAEHDVPAEPPPEAPHLVGRSPAGRGLLRELFHAARTSMPVLMTGETGTGKEVSANLLHAWSTRRARRFIPINCAAIPNEMLEAELFGYARGAFSGAVKSYDGQLAAAEGGSVFLDEVDDTPLSFQVKILRVLEDRVVSRLGENHWVKVDFRIVAATNRDLRDLIARGLFGADLYERLAIVHIRLPPLRDRREDIPDLCEQFFARFYEEEPGARARHQVTAVTAEALTVMTAYAWPGNVRELRNVVFGALVRKRSGRELLVSDLPRRLLRPAEPPPAATARGVLDAAAIELELDAGRFNLREAVQTLERSALELALSRSGGNAAAAAALLGEVGRGGATDPGATVRAMMRRLGIRPRGRGPRGGG